MRYWQSVTPGCMTEESDSETTDKIMTHRLMWRSDCELDSTSSACVVCVAEV